MPSEMRGSYYYYYGTGAQICGLNVPRWMLLEELSLGPGPMMGRSPREARTERRSCCPFLNEDIPLARVML